MPSTPPGAESVQRKLAGEKRLAIPVRFANEIAPQTELSSQSFLPEQTPAPRTRIAYGGSADRFFLVDPTSPVNIHASVTFS